MPSGGARNRSGPSPDPKSGRSDARGLVLTALPSGGFTGKIPAFPLPTPSARERALWAKLWRTPQAAAWDAESWRHYTVAQYVRWAVKAEDAKAPASVVAAVIRFADQIGLTPAGLKENGWRISIDEVAAKAHERESTQPAEPRMFRAGGA